MVTKTVGPTGCDYTCDGTSDEVQINQALVWANANPQSTIWIKGPYTYDIQNSILVGSYTTVQIDSSAKLRLKNAAAWTVNTPIITQLVTPILNIEIYGGEIDANYSNQTEALNSGYYPCLLFTTATNVNVHNMNMHDGAGHGLSVTTGTNVIFHDNTCTNLGGDDCLLVSCTTADTYSNTLTVRGNSGIHIKNTANTTIHNNYITGLNATNGGIAGVIIEDTTGNTVYPYIYNNVILDAYNSGILIIETGTGNTNRNKHCWVHHNTVARAGITQIYDYNSGCTIQGFNGAVIEYNTFDSCYNAGILQRYPPLSSGNIIQCSNNTISHTQKHQNSNYQYSYSGYGIANNYPTQSAITLFNNVVVDNVGNYYGVNGSNDIPTSVSITKYIPPTSYIQDEVSNYYVTNPNTGVPRTAYINQYPFDWQSKKIDLKKSIMQEKPPGTDGWCIADVGFEGSNITLDCYAYSLDEARQVIAAFYKEGRAILELGDIYSGWRINGLTANHSTDLQLKSIVPKYTYPYSILFLADNPIMESNIKKIRTAKVTSDAQTWNSSNCHAGNLVKNWNFHTWTQGNIITTWYTQTSAADNNWTAVCWMIASGSTTAITVGSQPIGIAINSTDTKMYVGNTGGGTVSVVNIPANTIAATITVGTNPVGIAITPNGTYVYVANKGSNNVKVITTASNTVTSTITVGSGPHGIAINPAGTLVYVANYGGTTVSVITISSNTVTATITVGTNPYAIAITPDGTKAYVTNEGSNNVKVIDISSNTVTATIAVGSEPNGIAINPTGTKVYVANWSGNTVSVIAIPSNTVTSTINVGTGPDGVTISPDGNKVYVANNSTNNVSIISTSTDTILSTVAVGTTPTCIALTSNSSKVYITDYGTTTVTVIDLTSTGQLIAVANSGTGNRVMTSPTGTTWTTQTSAADNNWTSICYASSIPLLVAVANSGTGNRVMTSPTGTTWTIRTSAADNDWRSVCWSPTLTKFVAVAGTTATYQVMYSSNGTTWSTATAALAQSWRSVCWSPGLSIFCAVAYTGTTQQIMTSTNATTWTARTTPISQAWTSVCWSVDLGMFAAVSENGSTQQIMTSTDGTNWYAQITPIATGLAWQSICWNSNQKCFVAVANTGVGNRVMASSDGVTWLIQTSSSDNNWSNVCYSPDISEIAAVANSGTGNRVMTCSNCTYQSLIDTAPTDWNFHTKGQRQSDDSREGLNSYQINGDGYTSHIGYISQPIQFESGLQYILAATCKVTGRTQGNLHIGIYSNNQQLMGLDYYNNTTDWTDSDTSDLPYTFADDETDAELRIYGDNAPNYGSYFEVDQVYVVRSKHFDTETIGGDITTTGTVDVVPDIMVTAVRLTAGSVTEGFNLKTLDTGSSYDVGGISYTLLHTDVLSAKINTRHRLDKISCSHCSDSSSYNAYTKVTYQCASLNSGAETQLYEFTTNSQYPNYQNAYYSPFQNCGINESCTMRYYGRSSDSNHHSKHQNCSCDHTDIITNCLGTGIQIYNTLDPITILQVCNKLDPGCTMEINADGTGSYRYVENLADITYQNVVYSRVGDTYNSFSDLLTLSSTGNVIYKFNTRYPITGIPYMILDVLSGNPQLAIANDTSGSPGTYYAIDQNVTTDQSGQIIYRALDQAANLSLKGSTIFYVRITPYTSQTCVLNSLFLYADIVTIDAERPKIFANGLANTFQVNIPNSTALEISLQYRDAHRII